MGSLSPPNGHSVKLQSRPEIYDYFYQRLTVFSVYEYYISGVTVIPMSHNQELFLIDN